jgi:hypothetical protein
MRANHAEVDPIFIHYIIATPKNIKTKTYTYKPPSNLAGTSALLFSVQK